MQAQEICTTLSIGVAMSNRRMHNPPHPSGVLKRLEMEPRGLTVSEFARTLKISRKQLSLVVNGHARITPDLSVRLARALVMSAELWLNMQAQFDLWQAEHNAPHRDIQPLREVKESATG